MTVTSRETTATSERTPARTTPTALDRLPGGLRSVVEGLLGPGMRGVFAALEWAEEEIVAARRRRPECSDRLYHSFRLLTPTHDRMRTEFVYRSHCAELLDRVAAGEDTRAGTAAEVCCALLEASLTTPLKSSATGLYMRMWQRARFPELPEFTEAARHHEALEREVIDSHEQFARRTLAVAERSLGEIDCAGRHHGEDVTCRYARRDQLALGV